MPAFLTKRDKQVATEDTKESDRMQQQTSQVNENYEYKKY